MNSLQSSLGILHTWAYKPHIQFASLERFVNGHQPFDNFLTPIITNWFAFLHKPRVKYSDYYLELSSFPERCHLSLVVLCRLTIWMQLDVSATPNNIFMGDQNCKKMCIVHTITHNQL